MKWLHIRQLVLAALVSLMSMVAARAADVAPELPNDTEIVGHVNVRQLLDSPLVQKHALDHIKNVIKGTPHVDTVLDELGINPFTDISSITVAGPGGADPKRGLLMVQGIFKPDKFKARAERAVMEGAPLKIVKAEAYTLYEVNVPDGPTPDVFVCVADEKTFLASPNRDMLLDALDKHTGKKKSEVSADLKARIAKHNSAESAWVVALSSGLGKGPIASDPTAKKDFLDKSVTLGASVDVTKDVSLAAVIDAKNDQDAADIGKKLTELVDQGKAILQAFAQSNKDLAPLIDVANSFKVTTEGKVVRVKGSVPNSVIEKAIKR
jgi:hypothetical protein